MATRYGTSYFTSMSAAIRYYRDYGDDADDVRRKIREGQIHIGKPPLKPGQRLGTTDGGKRYEISENPASRLKPNRLTPVRFSVRNKTYTGKAKLVGGKVKVFVTPNVARKINPKKSKLSARDVLGRIGGGPLVDFHELRSSQVDQLLEFASIEGYRKPANASGSKARMYYQSLVRRAKRGD